MVLIYFCTTVYNIATNKTSKPFLNIKSNYPMYIIYNYQPNPNPNLEKVPYQNFSVSFRECRLSFTLCE